MSPSRNEEHFYGRHSVAAPAVSSTDSRIFEIADIALHQLLTRSPWSNLYLTVACRGSTRVLMNFETLAIEIDVPIARLVLNRPDRLNAINSTMLRELTEAARWFDSLPDVRVVIFSGAGRAFCAGVDLKDSSRSGADHSWLSLRSVAGGCL